MNSLKLLPVTCLIGLILILTTCIERESTSPFDTDTPKETYTPSENVE